MSGVTDIQQSLVASSPEATTKFGQTQVQTQLSVYLEKAQTIVAGASKTTVSAAQALKGLNYTIPKKDPAFNIQSTSKDYDSAKEDDDEKTTVKMTKGLRFPRESSIVRKRSLTLTNIVRLLLVYCQESYILLAS